jgi:hypothetical protein
MIKNAASIVPHRERIVARRRRKSARHSRRDSRPFDLAQGRLSAVPVLAKLYRCLIAAGNLKRYRPRIGVTEAGKYSQKLTTPGARNFLKAEPTVRPPNEIQARKCSPMPGAPGNDPGFRAPLPASHPSRFRMWPRAARRAQKHDGGFLLPG